MPSLFPPPSPTLPDFSTLLIAGPYHPSAPIHLALSSDEGSDAKTILLAPSREVLRNGLIRFDDSWLRAHSGTHRLCADYSYPPSPAHLSIFLSMLRVSRPDDAENPSSWTGAKTTLVMTPNLIILTEPSHYFLTSEPEANNNDSENRPANSTALTLSSYLNLINRVFSSLSNLKDSTSNQLPKFVVFDSQLHKFKLPVLNQLSSSGARPINPEEDRRELAVLPLLEKQFEWVGIFDEDSSYIPSSQDDEREGTKKQLHLHRVGHNDFDDTQTWRWLETNTSSFVFP